MHILIILSCISFFKLSAMEIESGKPDWIVQATINDNAALGWFKCIAARLTQNNPYNPNLYNALEDLSSLYYGCRFLNALEKEYGSKKVGSCANRFATAIMRQWFNWYEDKLKHLLIRLHQDKGLGYSAQSIFHQAVSYSKPKLIHLLLDFAYVPKRYPHSLLGHTKDLKIAQLLINHGEDVNKPYQFWHSCLEISLGEGYSLEFVELLLKNNANVNFKNLSGNTALHEIALRELSNNQIYEQVKSKIQLLLKYNVSINELNRSEKTALDIINEEKIKRIQFFHGHASHRATFYVQMHSYLQKKGAKTAQEMDR